MPPKRKAASKAKPADDVPVANFTARRPVTNDNESGTEENVETQQLLNSDENVANLNVTILLENLPDSIVGISNESKSEPELIKDKDEKLNKRPVQKKMPKEKSKLKKQILEDTKGKKNKTRASSAENQRIKVEEKAVGSKNRKRPIERGDIMIIEPSKSISPINDQPKRNRRACSVDTTSSQTTISVQRSKQINKDNVEIKAEVEIEDEVPKKTKKRVKKEEPSKLPDKNLKTKKNNKKIITTKKENSPTLEQDIELLNVIQEKPRSKKGTKKEQINIPKEEQAVINKEEKINKQTSKNKAALKNIVDKKDLEKKCDLKVAQTKISSEKSDETSEKNDTDSIHKTPELISKQNQKGKQTNISTEKSEESSGKNDTDDSAMTSPPEIQPKRGRHKKQQINVDEKDIKVTKRGGRKVKGEDFEDVLLKSREDFEDVLLKSPPLDDGGILVEAGDLANGSPATPESGNNETKPVVVKRKTKTKK